MFVFFASRRRNTRCALVTGVQTVCSSDLLAAACSELPQLAKKIADDALFGVTGGSPTHDRIDGRFGAAHAVQIRSAPPEERTALGDTPYSLAELRWSLAHEAVVHLDDLLLRRTRIGLVSEQGGAALLPRIGEVCRSEEHTSELQSLMRTSYAVFCLNK